MELDVAEPCDVEQAIDAIVAHFQPGWFGSRDELQDVEVERVAGGGASHDLPTRCLHEWPADKEDNAKEQ